MFLPHLIRAGHTPQQAEHLMKASVTAWTGAPREAPTFLAIALTGYWERTSRLPTPPHAPYLRLYQAQMATIGRTWIQHRTHWDYPQPSLRAGAQTAVCALSTQAWATWVGGPGKPCVGVDEGLHVVCPGRGTAEWRP